MSACTVSGSGKIGQRGAIVEQAAIAQESDEALGVERVAACPVNDRPLQVGGKQRLFQEAADEPGGSPSRRVG